MITLIKNAIVMIILIATFNSCNQNSLETYFVDNQEQSDFFSVDMPASVLNLDVASLSSEQQEAYKSVKKLNMIGFRANDGNKVKYEAELTKVKAILDDKKYEELVRGGNSTDGKFVVKYLGNDSKIDELIVLGNANNKGFTIIRVLGDDMEPYKIMKLYSELDPSKIDQNKIKEFATFFK